MNKTALLCMAISVALAGCASTFETREASSPSDPSHPNNSVIYFEAAPYVEVYRYTVFQEKGQPGTKDCQRPVSEFKVSYHPGRKMIFTGYPSQYSSSTFSVTLNANGTLASVNSATTPVAAQLISTAESFAKDFLATAAAASSAALAPTPRPAILYCNSIPVLTKFAPIEDFRALPALVNTP